MLFYLALTLGLEEDAPAAIAEAISLIEEVGRRRGVAHPFQGMIATSDGEAIWAFRYSSEGKSRSRLCTTDGALRRLYPDRALFGEVSADARLIVSEPLGDVAGVWNEVPEGAYGVVGREYDELHAFTPEVPSKRASVPAARV
jgi:glutamine amidotransferase